MGWRRVRLFAAQFVGVPRYGSLDEALLLMVRDWEMSVSAAAVQVQVGSGVSPESAAQAFKEYTDRLLRVDRAAEKKALVEAMKQVSSLPPMSVRPLLVTPTKQLPLLPQKRN